MEHDRTGYLHFISYVVWHWKHGGARKGALTMKLVVKEHKGTE